MTMTQRRLQEFASTDAGDSPDSPEADSPATISAGSTERLRSPSLHYNGQDVLVLIYVPRIGFWVTQRVAKRGR